MDPARRAAAARASAGSAEAAAAAAVAKDRLARTTQIVESLRRGSAAARTAASSVPNGLVPGGLQVAVGPNARWDGASAPVQTGSKVNIVQNAPQAVLHWETFNVGRQTHLNFDQSAGKQDAPKWVAFNRVVGAAAAPSQILGKITAQGQVYVINQNGVIFGAGSQVNARALVASALPINDNLIEQGLLNNTDAQFLFSALTVPAGAGGTPAFNPPPVPPGFRYGDVVVEKGALLSATKGDGGTGGRVMLVGANVRNEGVIETPFGQAILAAGLQVGINAHRQDDPSLRGVDVWVGAVDPAYSGKVVNTGLIESRTGAITLVGRQIEQMGALESSTTVALNGRIDLIAAFGAVGYPDFDAVSGTVRPPFLNQFTGTVEFGPRSVTRVLPDLASTQKAPGSKLPLNSQINVTGSGIRMQGGSVVMAPSGDITFRAGSWTYTDLNGNRIADEPNITAHFNGEQRFLFSGGQIYLEGGSLVDASGTTTAFVPLAQHIVGVQLRGTELADSPLLRNTPIRGLNLVVDLRRSGTYGGREWIGTPLGDLTGLLNIIERDVAALTARGGSVTLSAGDSVVIAKGATVDVSGGFLTHEGGRVRTSMFQRNSHLIPVDRATPDVTYDGLYEGLGYETSEKWGISRTLAHPLAPLGAYNQKTHVEGAPGGTITISAPAMVVAGELRGHTIKGPRQLDAPPKGSTLKLLFEGQRQVFTGPATFFIVNHSPTPPEISFVPEKEDLEAPAYSVAGLTPDPLPAGLRGRFQVPASWFAESVGGAGFANVEIRNPDGEFIIPSSTRAVLPPGGSLVASGRNVEVLGRVVAPGGTISLTAHNFSPYDFEFLTASGGLGPGLPPPPIQPGRGVVRVASGALLSVAGPMVDHRPTTERLEPRVVLLDGGSLKLEGLEVRTEAGSLLDASGGIFVRANGQVLAGRGGAISLLAGRDPVVESIVGGDLVMDGWMQAYGLRQGGSLTLQALRLQIGGGGAPEGTLLIEPGFFRRGGFTQYNLIGLGGKDAAGGYLPAIRVAAGTVIEPVAENWVRSPFAQLEKALAQAVENEREARGPASAEALRLALQRSLRENGPDDLEMMVWEGGAPWGMRAIGRDVLRPYLRPVGVRAPAGISLQGLGFDDSFTPDAIEGLGIVVMEAGSRIVTDPRGSVSLNGDFVRVDGEILAPGGTITITGRSSFRIPPALSTLASFALPTVVIGPTARLSAAGVAVPLPDPYGRRAGILLPGGSITVSGNILADAGAVLDVSGASAVFDFHPTRLGGLSQPLVPRNAGVNSTPWQLRSVPVRVDSDGGLIDLRGGQFLYVDSTLLGAAGGPSARGGRLAVSSGRFYGAAENRSGADINLVVEQSGNAFEFGGAANLLQVASQVVFGSTPEASLNSAFLLGNSNRGIGYFAVSQFERGGFDYLDLGYRYNAGASPIPFGGNVEFRGAVNIAARGWVRLAAGGVVQASAPVNIRAPYVAIGQEFQPPLHPSDPYTPFFAFDAAVGTVGPAGVPPTFGPGSLNISAGLVDVGTLVTSGIGSVSLRAPGGDIRGSGILSVRGTLTLEAAQIYPTTRAAFDIFAYDPPGGTGLVRILQSGPAPVPLSAGGALRIYASEIIQGGTLRAPLGMIVLGWDGQDVDPSTPAVDAPFNSVVRTALATPAAQTVRLLPGSLASASGLDPRTGRDMLFPFGLSPDGLSWIDPRGVDVTVSGLPDRGVVIGANNVVFSSGAVVDLRGGGELLAYRWIPGTGGSQDYLGTASRAWSATASYKAGDLVTHEGRTWSARVDISPSDFAVVPRPMPSRFWAEVPESYAILPGFAGTFAPYNAFNTGTNAGRLGGDPGYVSPNLRQGEQLVLPQAVAGLPAGTYTLLPRRYGLFPGAFLVIPQQGRLPSSAAALNTSTPALRGSTTIIPLSEREEGSFFASAWTANAFHPVPHHGLVSRFEVVPPDVLAGRAKYELYLANDFISEQARRLGLPATQQLPRDAADLAIQGNTGLVLEGRVLSSGSGFGRNARVDISSFSDIYIVGPGGFAPPGAPVVLNPGVLSSWGAESLLIGGVRRPVSGGADVTVRSNRVVLDAPGSSLSAGDVILASRQELRILGGSRVNATGMKAPAQTLSIVGDGSLVRVAGDRNAPVSRTGLTGSTAPLLVLGPGSVLQGGSVWAESTHAADFDPAAEILADTVTLGAGQISIVLQPQPLPLAGEIITPHLVLEGVLLDRALSSRRLRLFSSQAIDIYGSGPMGGASLAELDFLGAGIRGYASGGGGPVITAGQVRLANPRAVAAPADAASGPGVFNVQAGRVVLGAGNFRISGYASSVLAGAGGVLMEADGSLQTPDPLTLQAPLITGADRARYSVNSQGPLSLLSSAGPATVSAGAGADLGFTGSSVVLNSDVASPSGRLTFRALSGPVTVGGRLSVEGFTNTFLDVSRHADAGEIQLLADAGSVALLAGSRVSVAAAAGGGRAGDLVIRSPGGVFTSAGDLLGTGTGSANSGSFLLDAASVADFSALSAELDASGFFRQRDFRIRTGDVTIAGVHHARRFALAADSGSITVTGHVDASGATGGRIELAARNNLTLAPGSILDVSGADFDSAGKGGHIVLEAGATVGGAANPAALLNAQAGSEIRLGVASFVPGDFLTPGSSAFLGRFEGTLHLRAPRLGTDVRVDPIGSTLVGGSAVVVEGFQVYTPAGGAMNIALRNAIHADNTAWIAAGEAAMTAKLLSSAPNPAALAPLLVLAPGVEVVNTAGSLTLGLANTAAGSTNVEARYTADWDLSGWRYGTRQAPGVLTLRARGDVILNNTLSDGFTPAPVGTPTEFRDIGHNQMWLATLAPINPLLPVNTQSWSYRIAAGADHSSASFRQVLPESVLNVLEPGRGGLLVGEFYPAVPNTLTSGAAAAIGPNGQTADTIRISTTDADRGTRFEVLRTGTGSIDIAAGRDVQLRNPFATIYTAGVALPDRTRIFQAGDFVAPSVEPAVTQGTLGAIQQAYPASYAMAGGSLRIHAARDIGRFAIDFVGTTPSGLPYADSSRQLPTNWLYRRGYVDPATGRFGRINEISGIVLVNDEAMSTTWWVDYSNFFQGFGALGGGAIEMVAGRDLVNADAAIPTNARMAGQDPSSGATPATRTNLAPNLANLLEHGGGDLLARAGRNIDGGTFYVERGAAILAAGAEVTTNRARSPSRGNLGLASGPASGTSYLDPLTWQAVMLFGGRSGFDVSARGNILIGPATAAFLSPQGINNKFWYKTQFQTLGAQASLDVRSFGGAVTHRLAVTLPGGSDALPILSVAHSQAAPANIQAAGYYRPWLRFAESSTGAFRTMSTVALPALRSTAFRGDLSVTGTMNLFPSPAGELELVAAGSVVGLNPSGITTTTVGGSPTTVTAWTAANINLSDSNPASQPGALTPLAFQQAAGVTTLGALRTSPADPFAGLSRSFQETGSFTGPNAFINVKSRLHASTPVHAGNPNPVRIYAAGGDLTGLALFSGKKAQIVAANDITDIAFYIQHPRPEDISIVSAGRDIIPFNENAPVRAVASDIGRRNIIVDLAKDTVVRTPSGVPVSTKALAGDIQLGGPGFLEVLAGRDVDLGTGPNFVDGTGTGITTIGRLRNPFLPFEGASVIVLAGVEGKGGGPALGLAGSSLNLEQFKTTNLALPGNTEEHKAIAALLQVFAELKRIGGEAAETKDYSEGDAIIQAVFKSSGDGGSLFTRARDIRTVAGGGITIAAPQGGVTMASSIFGNPLTPPGIVTEAGGEVNILTRGDVDIGQARIFTLRGGDLTIWSIEGNIAAGTAPKTVVTAPPTRVTIDAPSGAVETDLGGLATGGGIGVLAAVEGVEPGTVSLIAPRGTVDAGDAGIRATGNIQIAAAAVVNADNIAAGGTSTGVPTTAPPAAPNIGGLSSAAATSGAATSAANQVAEQTRPEPTPTPEPAASIIEVEVLGYGGSGRESQDEEEEQPAE